MANLVPDAQPQKLSVAEFKGMNQSVDESLIELGETHNAQNFITSQGILEVTPGNVKHIAAIVPGGVKTLMAFYKNNFTTGVVTRTLLASSSTNIYRWSGSAWVSIKSGLSDGYFSFINYQQGMTEILIMTNGVDPMFKWDGTTFSNLGGAPYTPKGTSMALHYERLWVTGDRANPNMLYASDAFDPEFWEINYVNVPGAQDPLADAGVVKELPTWDGGICIGVSNIFDDIVIFKTYSIWKIIGTYPGEYDDVKVFSAVGAIAKRSIIDAGNVSMFLAMDGIYIYDGVKTYPVSFPIKKVMAEMNTAYRDKAVGIFYDNRYILAIPTGSSTENNTVIDYDLLKQTFNIKRGFNVTDFLVFEDKLLFSNNNSYVLEYDKGDTFDGVPIVAFWDTPYTALSTPSLTKVSSRIYADTEILTPEGQVKISAICDQFNASVTTDKNAPKGLKLRGKGRKFKLRFENVSGSRFRIRFPELHFEVQED